ncbi:peptidoglycan DD-metalloendopeptidase family protein [Roseospirillum parvum]|uniref:Peptidase family M23 n=1 Tax=Roseospirillum parvum TaxID=83401 RepID=A0A1G7YH60_9PROT|nr:M23 family metallopeptidase [Roseospirillum parvum]SDG95210.1 Peptidase family M23 [Roseospirillum parvum]
MSAFDPLTRELSPFQRAIQRVFAKRQIVIRGGSDGHHLREVTLGSRLQMTLAIGVVLLVAWGLFTTAMLGANGIILAAKEHQVREAENAYRALLTQVTAYRDRVATVARDLEQNHGVTIALMEEKAELDHRLESLLSELEQSEEARQRIEDARARLHGKLERLKTEVKVAAERGGDEASPDPVAELRDEVGDVAARGEAAARERARLAKELDYLEQEMVQVAETGAMDIDTIDLELRKVVLQRDLAYSERDSLAHRVAELETTLGEMERVQLAVFERFADLAEEQVAEIEEHLAATGLDLDELLDKARARVGVGGPFVPAQSVLARDERLKHSVATLNDRIDRWESLSGLTGWLPLAVPLDEYFITSGFGLRTDPMNGRKAMHEGLDFGAPLKAKIKVTAPGVVTFAGWKGNYGRLVEVDHGMGLKTRYGHMSSIAVKVGQKLERGAVVGRLGNSGRSTGPHLHYEVRQDDQPVNPMKFIRAGKHVL